MFIFLPIILVTALFILIVEFSSATVFGPLLKEDLLNAYLEKNLSKYKLNPFSYDLLFSTDKPFISEERFGIMSEWYISGFGRIPRWSPWNKKLNEKQKLLIEEELLK